jgi:hypothetical protein
MELKMTTYVGGWSVWSLGGIHVTWFFVYYLHGGVLHRGVPPPLKVSASSLVFDAFGVDFLAFCSYIYVYVCVCVSLQSGCFFTHANFLGSYSYHKNL